MATQITSNTFSSSSASTGGIDTPLMWFHDVAGNDDGDAHQYDDDCTCQGCSIEGYQRKWDKERERMEQFKYGVCMDCGIGLDDANDFFYDRREKQCDCFTCNTCFEHFFGKDELFNSANWRVIGIQAPQYIRASW